MGEKLIDYSPDRNRSFSSYDITATERGVRWVLEVKDVGTLVIFTGVTYRAHVDPDVEPLTIGIVDPIV